MREQRERLRANDPEMVAGAKGFLSAFAAQLDQIKAEVNEPD
jgi:hypothetical protein